MSRRARMRTFALAAAVVAGGIVYASTSSANAAPSCASPANQARLGMTGQVDCLIQVSKWCQKYHPQDGNGLCTDKVYGAVPNNY